MSSPGYKICKQCGRRVLAVEGVDVCLACMLRPDVASDAGASTPAVRRLGDYELIEEIARGGMGIVYRARQVSLNRIVALKVLLAGGTSRLEMIQRFRSEAAAAARLKHPNIISVHGTGEADGEHFFSMELIDGESLGDKIRKGPLPAREAVEILLPVVAAVGHAHDQGFIHRDIKPSNILLDKDETPHVMDFGLAKRIDDDSDLTQTGQVLGSPSYMPPEQAEGRDELVGKTSDVYALGAVLYAMVTGRPPFQAPTAVETIRMVVDNSVVSPRLLDRGIPKDVETVCLKCLQKDPRRRYGSVEELGEELSRIRQGEPIRARPISKIEHFWRWCQRRPLVAGLSGALALVTIAGVSGVFYQWRRATAGEVSAKTQLYAADMTLALQAAQKREWPRVRSILDRHQSDDLQGWEWRHLDALSRDEPQLDFYPGGKVVQGDIPALSRLLFSEGHRLLTVLRKDMHRTAYPIQQYRMAEGREEHLVESPVAARDFSLSPEGIWWLDKDGNLRLGLGATASSGKLPIAVARNATRIDVSPDGKWIATTGEGQVVVSNLEGKNVQTLTADMPILRWVESGSWIAVGERLGHLRVVGLGAGSKTIELRGHRQEIYDLAASADGKWLVSAANDGAKIWKLPSGTLHADLSSHNGAVLAVAISPDNRTVATGGLDRNPKIWNLETGREVSTIRGFEFPVRSLTFSPDGLRLAAGSVDGMARVWNLPIKQGPVRNIAIPEDSVDTSISVDSRVLTSLNMTDSIRLWALEGGHEIGKFPVSVRGISAGEVGPGGAWLLGGRINKEVQLWRLEGTSIAPGAIFQGSSRIWSVTFSLDGKRAAAADEFGNMYLLSVPDLTLVQSWPIPMRTRGPLRFSPHGKYLTVSCNEGSRGLILVADAVKGGALRSWETEPPNDVVFSHDESRIASVHDRGAVKIWEIASGKAGTATSSLLVRWTAAVFSPDDRRLITGSNEGTVQFFSTDSLKEMGSVRAHSDEIRILGFIRNSSSMVSVGNTSATVWPATEPKVAKVADAGKKDREQAEQPIPVDPGPPPE